MHELTERIKQFAFITMNISQIKECDQIITAYMKERADILKYRDVKDRTEKAIDQAFGIEKKSLEEKFRNTELRSVTSGNPVDGAYHIYHDADYEKLAQIAKAHFKENPHELNFSEGKGKERENEDQ